MTRVVEFEGQVRVEVPESVGSRTPSIEVFYPSARELPEGADADPHFTVKETAENGFLLRSNSPLNQSSTSGVGPEASDPLFFADWIDLVASLEGMISRELLASRGDRVHLHAAAALDQAGAVLALGPSGAGKSSLALAWSRAGLPLFGDDVVLVGSGGTLEPHRRLIKTDVERIAEHGLDPRQTVAFQPGEPEIWFDPAKAGGWAREAVAPGLIARVVRDPECVGVRVSPMRATEVLQALITSAFPTGITEPERMLDALIPMAEQARGVDLTFGSTAEAASEMVQLLRSR